MPKDERRKASRFPLHADARLEGEDGNGGTVRVTGKTRDVSSAGVYVVAGRRLAAHVKVRVALYLAAERLKRFMKVPSVRVEVVGEVVRSEPEGMAVRFGPKFDIRPALAPVEAGGESEREPRTRQLQPGGEDKVVLFQTSGKSPEYSARRRKEKRS
jgi:hypothetical protein